LNIQDIGEQGLLKRVQAFCPADVTGDDAAVVPIQTGKRLVITTDVLVDGVHFSDRTTSPEDAGWRAAAANLSDLAAMGASPVGVTVGLSLPGTVQVDWVERFYQGLFDCLNAYNTVIVGGDIVRSPTIAVSITAFGEVDPESIIRRSAAQTDWAIVATGYHGSSRAGLELLLHSEQGNGLPSSDRAFLIHAHQRPRPRLDILPFIHKLPSDCAIAGMDSSDGLADAVLQICRASGVGATLERSQIPIAPSLSCWQTIEKRLHWALFGGEDFELVLCLPPKIAKQWIAQLGNGAAIVGMTTSKPQVWLIDSSDPSFQPQQITSQQSFQHFD
jgi:thiamine-monophosphate kinase